MILSHILETLYPSLCRSCLAPIAKKKIFCDTCEKLIKPVVSLHLAAGCGYTLKVHAIGAYQEPLKTLILKKFSCDILASKQIAQLMFSHTPMQTMPVDIIMPIPLHWTRYASRGFNQAYEIARDLAPVTGGVVCSAIKRIRKTAFQSRLEIDERKKNVKGAFALKASLTNDERKKMFTDKHIVIIDDLCTTGATLVNVAKIITPYRPASVSAFVACRAV